MKILVVICCVFAVSQALSYSQLLRQEWNTYKVQHRKQYSNPLEEMKRMTIFMENRMKIAQHNEKFARGEVTYTMALNEFGDMSHEEFVSKMTGPNRRLYKNELRQLRNGALKFNGANVQVPDAIDWRELGAVSSVKNQGSCGSCWSFGATGVVEGQYWKAGKKVLLSEQNLIDCAGEDYGNAGCGGGFRNYGLQYILDNSGVDTEESYPYEATEKSCRFNAKNVGATISKIVILPKEDQKALKEALATVGPIGVAMDAGSDTFQFYENGVMYDTDCDSDYYSLNHEVLAVGYGNEQGQDYWIVKNSWGTTWGDKGFFKISTKNNNCGIATDTSYVIV